MIYVPNLAIRICSLIMISCLLSAGCAHTRPASETSLFDRLGGLPAVTAVIDKTIDRSATDPRTRRSFDGVRLKPIKESVVSFVCQASGGPCKYEGASMSKAHGGLGITSAEFDAMVAHLIDTLDQFKVPAREKNDLLKILGPLKNDILLQ